MDYRSRTRSTPSTRDWREAAYHWRTHAVLTTFICCPPRRSFQIPSARSRQQIRDGDDTRVRLIAPCEYPIPAVRQCRKGVESRHTGRGTLGTVRPDKRQFSTTADNKKRR